MNLPNWLTILRILLAPVVVILLVEEKRNAALAIFVLAVLTDGLDGLLARFYRQHTNLGMLLDPVADKLLLGSAFVTLGILGWVPVWLVILGVGRDIVLVTGSVVLYCFTGCLVYPPSLLGKLTTVLQLAVVVGGMMVHGEGVATGFWVLVWATGIVTLCSGLGYLVRGIEVVAGTSQKVTSA
ncbi:MAG: CDP-alcohol phosphatidyltransferase family protein [Candidatus Methylomirabilales bacterium]